MKCQHTLIEFIVVAITTITNPGSSDQNIALKLRSKPGHSFAGIPTHGASSTRSKSNKPHATAAAQPVEIPIMGTHCCNRGVANSLMPVRTSRVAPARIGAAIIGAPSGMSGSLPSTTEIIVADISIRTVPATVGVMIRRSSESLVMKANCIRAEIAIRLDSMAGPPSDSAVMQTAMNEDEDATISE